MAVELASMPKRNRTRSPSYPYLDLPASLEKAAALWKAEGRHAVAVNVAMQHWGYKEDSSTGYSCVAALKKFGLVDHEGMGETRQMRLSNLALTILLDNDPGSPARRDALRAAALNPRIHGELWERYGNELPSEPSLKRFLVVERAFNEAAVEELLAEYRATMAFAGLNVGTVRGSTPAAPTGAAVGFAPLPPIVPVPAVVPEPAVSESSPRPEPPPSAPRMPARAADASGLAWNSAPAFAPPSAPPTPLRSPPVPVSPRSANGHAAPPRQPGLFHGEADDEEFAGGADDEEGPTALRASRTVQGQEREADPWSRGRRELPVPLDNDLVARVPYPMTEEDFALLLDTLQLWKKRLVRPRR